MIEEVKIQKSVGGQLNFHAVIVSTGRAFNPRGLRREVKADMLALERQGLIKLVSR